MRLFTGLSRRKTGFDARSIREKFSVDKFGSSTGFSLRVLGSIPVCTVTVTLHYSIDLHFGFKGAQMGQVWELNKCNALSGIDVELDQHNPVVCLTTGSKPFPKRSLHILRSTAPSFIEYGHHHHHPAVCLTTGSKPLPKRSLHILRSKASSFK